MCLTLRKPCHPAASTIFLSVAAVSASASRRATGFDVDAEGLIGEDANVAYIWDKEPTDEEREAVEGCLSHDAPQPVETSGRKLP